MTTAERVAFMQALTDAEDARRAAARSLLTLRDALGRMAEAVTPHVAPEDRSARDVRLDDMGGDLDADKRIFEARASANADPLGLESKRIK